MPTNVIVSRQRRKDARAARGVGAERTVVDVRRPVSAFLVLFGIDGHLCSVEVIFKVYKFKIGEREV